MSDEDDGFVTRWIGDLKAGGDSVAQHHRERYFNRFVYLARARLGSSTRPGTVNRKLDVVRGVWLEGKS